MASSFADRPVLPPRDAQGGNDPFVSPTAPSHHRYSNFDNQLFALGPSSSPGQAKRALEAHLAETERRMEEAGKLGTALVQQQKELTDRLKDVEKLQAEGELTPELRTKLVDIEKEYNDVARETARAFLPKQRVPSNEAAGGSPYVPEGRGGRRSVSPSKFESQATGSPTKLSVPNRKIRNQPSNRVHDIEFAAEISTSLLAQVRNLQSLLAEKDEELRDIKVEKSKIEIEAEGFQQRVKTLDESEHRYKDENWNLETQIHELIASQKESADREKKLSQSLNILQAEKSQVQKELDEVKVSHSKLAEDHESIVKQHDIELGTAKRNVVLAETERTALQRKIDDLTGQNQELAKAVSSQRGRTLERDHQVGMSDEDFQTANDDITPEHSPPPSPVKGTPRHSVLESETLKTSLLHAQRTIQSQRSQLHREKTEKLELKRMLQDSRDELEKARNNDGGASNRRSRKVDSREFKKPSKALLGGLRTGKSEVFTEDPEWEEHSGDNSPKVSPSLSTPSARKPAVGEYPQTTDASANEASDAFETANERGTETDDFQTGAEEFSGSDDAETETESPSKGRSRRPQDLNVAGNRSSFHSTASTSADEDSDFTGIKTPIAQSHPKMRLKVHRGVSSRRSRQASEEPALQSSPASFATGSASGTPQQPGQSLFAELAELEGSDDESSIATPSRSVRSLTPASVTRNNIDESKPPVPPLPNLAMVNSALMTDPVKKGAATVSPIRPAMVDAGVMTEPVISTTLSPPVSAFVADKSETEDSAPKADRLSVLTDHARSRPDSTYSDASAQHDPGMEQKLAQFPLPPTMQKPAEVNAPTLAYSAIDELIIDPVEEPKVAPPAPPILTLTPVESQHVEPVAEPEPVLPSPPALGLSSILSEIVEPKAEPEVVVPAPVLAYTSLTSEAVEPVPEPEVAPPAPPALALSVITSETIEPKAEPVVVLSPPPPAPVLGLSSVQSQEVEPRAEPEAQPPAPPALSFSPLWAHNIEPQAEPDVKQPTRELGYSSVISEVVEPRVEPEPLPPALGLSEIKSWDVQPRPEPTPIPPSLTLTSVVSEEVEPIIPPTPEPMAPQFSFSAIDSIETTPASPRSPKRDGFVLSRNLESPFNDVADGPRTPKSSLLGAVAGRKKGKDFSEPVIAEDETRQSPSEDRQPDTPESQRPFKEISSNSETRPPRKQTVPTSDQSAQTSLTAEAIDQMLKTRGKGHGKSLSINSSLGNSSVGSPGTVRVRRYSQESVGTPREMSEEPLFEGSPLRRPSSASSSRAPASPLPPLPANHKEVIEAARSSSSHGATTSMGPPLWPASAMRNQRPRTPSARPESSASAKGTPTPKANRTGTGVLENTGVQSPTKASAMSRQSSVTSFASEIDTRFNIRSNGLGIDPTGFGPNTDPRMIQAITQTMIGEYLWKYTRKVGRGDMSETRHRRYFWVHPYTRTLYWSDRDPSTAGRAALKAKSVPIEAVRVVTDDNPMPPGLHRKSLIVISPGRAVKFTCTTGQRHETWFNALSYLLLRTNEEGQTDAEEMAGNITQADVDEFNPQVGGQRSTPAATGPRSRAPPSLSSYNSRTTQNQSPSMDTSMNLPTLTPTAHKNASAQRPSVGTLGRISGYWKNSQVLSGTFSSLRSRTTSVQNTQTTSTRHGIYEADQVHDSAEDLRVMYERQDREADRLENVRACCDGKHDVGTLHHHSNPRRGRHSASHAGQAATPMSSMRSRA